jgi:RNA polymerase sigma factor (sigma-70 family)
VEYLAVASQAVGARALPSFETFVHQSWDRTLAVVVLTTGSLAAAEDACQDAFAKAYLSWSRVGRLDQPDRWVRRVATRAAIDEWRKQQRLGPIPDGESYAEELVQRIWLKWGLSHLSPMQRRTVLLRFQYGMTDVEVSLALGSSPATIRTHLHRARIRLRQILRPDASGGD